MYKLGKTPARPDAVAFKFSTYFNTTKLPTPPTTYGHYDLVKVWGMDGNDAYGDCVWAGAAHEHHLLNREAGRTVTFGPKACLSDYAAVTGFRKDDPNSDQGTDMSAAAAYRRKTGIIDSTGKRHKVEAYIKLGTGNVAKLKQAVSLFGAVGIGINFPGTAMDQFNNGEPWDVVPGADIEGGHYVPVVGYDEQYIYVVTWGAVQKMTYAFYEKYNDEALVYLNQDAMAKGKTIDGFDDVQLNADLKAL